MPYIDYIKELQGQARNSVNTIEQVNLWLDKYKSNYDEATKIASCTKRYNYIRDTRTSKLPFICTEFKPHCIFIGMYSELLELRKLSQLEENIGLRLATLDKNKRVKSLVFDWMVNNKELYKSLTFQADSQGVFVGITISSEPYQKILVKIEKESFKHSIELKRVFDEMVYLDYL